MKTKTTKTSGIKVTANVKAGGFNFNHNPSRLRVKAGLKAGAMPLRPNHTTPALLVVG